MTPTPFAAMFNAIFTHLTSWAHAIAPVGTEHFELVTLVALACCLLFAVIAMYYALKPWAEKAMFSCIAGAAVVSLLLQLSMRHTPEYVGEGPLWQFALVAQYLPGIVLSVGGLYVLYRVGSRCLRRRN